MDLYHCQIVEGDLAVKLRQYVQTGNVGHVQIAGVPERNEPDVGEPCSTCWKPADTQVGSDASTTRNSERDPGALRRDWAGWLRTYDPHTDG